MARTSPRCGGAPATGRCSGGRDARTLPHLDAHPRELPRVLEGAEDLLELVRSRDLELVVAAILRRLVGPPPLEDRGVPETIALHGVVLPFAHAFDAHRFPRQILARAPPALTARHARAVVGFGPFTPWMLLESIGSKRLEISGELTA